MAFKIKLTSKFSFKFKKKKDVYKSMNVMKKDRFIVQLRFLSRTLAYIMQASIRALSSWIAVVLYSVEALLMDAFNAGGLAPFYCSHTLFDVDRIGSTWCSLFTVF